MVGVKMRFITVVFYKTKMIFNNKLLLIMLLLLSLSIIYFSGSALDFTKHNKIQAIWVDDDNSQYSKLLFDRISSKEGINFVKTDLKTGQRLLQNNEKEILIQIKKGFDSSLRQSKSNGKIALFSSPTSVSKAFIMELTSGEVIRMYSANLSVFLINKTMQKNGDTLSSKTRNDIFEKTDSYWYPKPLMSLLYFDIDPAKPNSNVKTTETKVNIASVNTYMYSTNGMLPLLIMIFLIFGTGWIVEEKLNGTLCRLATIKYGLLTSFITSSCAMFFSGLCISLMYSFIVFVAFKVIIFQSVTSIFALLAYILLVTAMCQLITSFFGSPMKLQAFAPAFTLFTSIIGGCFWNIGQISSKLKWLSDLTPQGQFLNILNDTGVHKIQDIVFIIMTSLLISCIMFFSSYLLIISKIKCMKNDL
jgi:ABC-type multidrug transport system permease subunit